MKTNKLIITILIFIIAISFSSCASAYSSCPSYALNNSKNNVTHEI